MKDNEKGLNWLGPSLENHNLLSEILHPKSIFWVSNPCRLERWVFFSMRSCGYHEIMLGIMVSNSKFSQILDRLCNVSYFSTVYPNAPNSYTLDTVLPKAVKLWQMQWILEKTIWIYNWNPSQPTWIQTDHGCLQQMSDTKEIGLWVQYHMKQTNLLCTVKQQKNIQVQDQNKWKKKKKKKLRSNCTHKCIQ